MSDPPRIDPYAALKNTNYRRFVLGWFASSISIQMMSTAIGWELYERTNSSFMLGMIGLCQALPVIAFALPGGQLADIFDRKRVLFVAQTAMMLCALALAAASYFNASVWYFYLIIICAGTTKAFGSPSRASMLPLLVPDDVFQNAVTWNSIFFHTAATVGPLISGGVIYLSRSGWPVYMITTIGSALFILSLFGVHPRPQQREDENRSIKVMLAGAGFVWREKTILAALTLDLMAVLFGGATALFPVFARDILHVGAVGLGAMRAAPYVGAVLMSFALAHLPPFKNAGRSMLLAVAGYGVAMIAFGLSKWFAVSLACLLISGMLDNISVVIRHVLVQVKTPDALRGRVSAVNTVFIESSNELGSFESGLVASIFGTVVSVVSGGIGTIVVVGLIALRWPEIRRLRQLKDINPPSHFVEGVSVDGESKSPGESSAA